MTGSPRFAGASDSACGPAAFGGASGRDRAAAIAGDLGADFPPGPAFATTFAAARGFAPATTFAAARGFALATTFAAARGFAFATTFAVARGFALETALAPARGPAFAP